MRRYAAGSGREVLAGLSEAAIRPDGFRVHHDQSSLSAHHVPPTAFSGDPCLLG